MESGKKSEICTIGGGCFWSIEALFNLVKGIEIIISGYANGKTKNPTYKEICTKNTNFAEVCQLKFNPKIITFEEILTIFFSIHNASVKEKKAKNQYRSIICFNDEEQKSIALKIKKKVEKNLNIEISTEICPLSNFYQAEDFHQNYYIKNYSNNYCISFISGKIESFKKNFQEFLK